MSIQIDRIKKKKLKEFAELLSKIPGAKDIVIHESLISKLNSFCKLSSLVKMDIRKLYKLLDSPLDDSFKKLVYILPPSKQAVKIFQRHYEIDKSLGIKRNILVIIVPKLFKYVSDLFDEYNIIHEGICLEDFCFGWTKYADDILSLDISDSFPQSFIHHVHYFDNLLGKEVGELLNCNDISNFRVHCFGSEASSVYLSLKNHLEYFNADNSDIITSDSPKMNRKSSVSSLSTIHSDRSYSPINPLIFIFGRSIDFTSCLIIPMSFECLIHEKLTITDGNIQIPNDKNKKISYNQLSESYFQNLRNLHISFVYENLISFSNDLENERLCLVSKFDISSGQSRDITQDNLAQVKAKLTPLLENKRNLGFISTFLQEIIDKMTIFERVEDLLELQHTILQSATGGCVPYTNSGDTFKMSPRPTSNLMDNMNNKTCKLILEWISSNHGDELISALRSLCLISVTHDGIDQKLYKAFHRAIFTSAGSSFFLLLESLRRCGLLYPRNDSSLDLDSIDNENLVNSETEKPLPFTSNKISIPINRLNQIAKSAVKMATKNLKRSKYNHVYNLLHLGNSSQTENLQSEPKSASFPFVGEHTPIIARLSENIFFHELNANQKLVGNQDKDGEIVSLNKIKESLKYLNLNKNTIENLGKVYEYSDSRFKPSQNAMMKLPPLLQENQLVIIIVTGGCCMAEISSLRLVAKRRNWKLLILTHSILSANDLIRNSALFLNERL